MTTSTIERHGFISFALTRWKRLDIKRAFGTHRTVYLLGPYALKFPAPTKCGANWWISLGFHFDHTDPSLTIHLPGIVICVGYCKQPGFRHSLRRRI